MKSRVFVKSLALIASVVALLLVMGFAFESSPADEIVAADRQPTTTTTTEPPPEGVLKVRIDNGSFRPSNVKLNLEEAWIVRWVNEDPREYMLADKDGLFETTLAEGDEFEFDYSTLEPGIYRVFATVGFQRIPGTIDSRPEQ
ncbi:MAG: cupredoxin domain-containing protein [Actinomycetota bacterium]